MLTLSANDKAEDADIKAFLKYVNGEPDSNPFVQKIETKVEEIRANKEWRQEYMTLLMREEEIREESIQVGRIQGAVRILKSMNVSRAEIKSKIIQTSQLSEGEAGSYLNNSQ